MIRAPGQRLTAASSAVGMGNVCVRMAKFACRHHSLRHIRRRLVTGTLPPTPTVIGPEPRPPVPPRLKSGLAGPSAPPRPDERVVCDSVRTLNNLEATRIAASFAYDPDMLSRQRILPAGFIEPCLPTKALTPPSGGL